MSVRYTNVKKRVGEYSIVNSRFPKIGEKEPFSSIQCLDTHPVIVIPGLGVLKLALKGKKRSY